MNKTQKTNPPRRNNRKRAGIVLATENTEETVTEVLNKVPFETRHKRSRIMNMFGFMNGLLTQAREGMGSMLELLGNMFQWMFSFMYRGPHE